MRAVAFASLFAVASAGACSADDQSALADAKTVGEKSDKCGKSALGLSGINHDKFTSCVQSDLGISAACSECYYSVADYGFKNCKAACLLGWCKSGCLSCTQPAQDKLSDCTGFSPATADPCLESTAASCSSDEAATIQGMDSNDFGDKTNTCGHKATNLITLKVDHDKFNACLSSAVGIGNTCSECYAVTADYGVKNCKAACLLGWCKQGCLDCTADAQADLAKCTGFSAGSPKPCLKSAAGACSADEQAKLGVSATVGKAGSDCGLGAYNVLTGNFNHDKFNSCFTDKVGISSGCSECYATNGEFAAKNCKAACLLGWCKQGCLDCSTADAPKKALDSCTGFTSGSADPCMDDVAV
jgi:hypothetical protein